ncbi:MAG TPA: cyclic nucleotide-binding domain-containing protein [Candidatus Acidoferrales bacterium]|nr:cyclic nucleotide-binding domain-containing protein [Candidatus Acidoferrales bacterium]
MKVAASTPPGNYPELDQHWTAILRGDGFAALKQRLGRRAFGLFPGRPRCKICNAPYGGPVALPFRLLGYRPSQKTPHVCARCLEWAPEGGAIVPLSVLYAHVRGYASLTESAHGGAVPPLLSRFYDAASRVLLRHEAVLGQIAGDQVMGLFVPGLCGRDYPRKAVAAAVALLEAVGYRAPGGAWIEIGIGIATGEEFCGNVGGGGFKDFTAVGEVTNTAARLTSRATPGEVIVDSATRAAAAEFAFNNGDVVTLEARSAPIQTYRVASNVAAVDGSVEPVAVLLRSPLFAGLSPKMVASLQDRVRRRSFPAGTYLTREGEPADALLVIERGLVRVSRTSRQGRELVLDLLGAGELIGELGVLETSGTQTADAMAVDATSCVALGRDDLRALVRTTPELGLRLLATLVDQIHSKDEELAEVAFLDVPGRLAHKLLQLADRHGEKVASGVRITARVPQGELAAMVGSSRENVNRALGRFVASGAVAIDRGSITILDPDALRALC